MRFPAIPLKGLVAFPGGIYNIDVGRERSKQALEVAMENDRLVLLVAQKEIDIDLPDSSDIYEVGTVCRIKQMARKPQNIISIAVEGLYSASISSVSDDNSYMECDVAKLDRGEVETQITPEEEALVNVAKRAFDDYVSKSTTIPKEFKSFVSSIERAYEISDKIGDYLDISFKEKQTILEIDNSFDRLDFVISILNQKVAVLSLEEKIEKRIKEQMEKNQTEYYLREKIKAINEELEEGDDISEDVDRWRDMLKDIILPEDVKNKVEKEIKRYSIMKISSPESNVIRTYLDTLLELPWNKLDEENQDMKKSEEILRNDHYGLDKVKERVLEHLAVLWKNKDIKSPILCLVGPPGTGKTSIAKSIATATGRKFVRMSLGGVRDEAEIRGHRRTYIGAIPGRIINAIKEVDTRNPVFLLDEIDKLGSDYKGDPSSALLEVLDPEQNKTFVDHYLEVPFDLSKVMFIATANSLDTIPGPLRDRMEIIQVHAYTYEEKFHIAKKYLAPKKMKELSVNKSEFSITDKAIKDVISYYTREAGVRNLEREIATLIRKVIKKIAVGEVEGYKIKPADLEELLGKKKVTYDKITGKKEVGVATGMAWTAVGGDTLFIEVVIVPGTGKIELTGQLGKVMQESAKAAISFVRTVADKYDIDKEFYKNTDIHIHVPEGAVPKDGPSAGVTMSVAIISALSKTPIRKDVSMTGEVTLTGRVLPVGGIKEKVIAAHRAGVKKVLLPKENERDIDDIPESVREDLEFVLVEKVDQALAEVL